MRHARLVILILPNRKAHQLFDSLEEELEYLEERDLDIALADLLESMGRLSEAAELHYSEGRREEAIELFLRETENKMLCAGLKNVSSRSFGIGYLLAWTLVLYAPIQPCRG